MLLYGGATLAEAADDVGVSGRTASNRVECWNEGGLGKLTPNFRGGTHPKLDEKPTSTSYQLVLLLVGSPHLNLIEPVWKSLKWESSPLIIKGEDEQRTLLTDLFDQLTEK